MYNSLGSTPQAVATDDPIQSLAFWKLIRRPKNYLVSEYFSDMALDIEKVVRTFVVYSPKGFDDYVSVWTYPKSSTQDDTVAFLNAAYNNVNNYAFGAGKSLFVTVANMEGDTIRKLVLK